MTIEHSVALVTGANRGLGKALVAALVEAGAAPDRPQRGRALEPRPESLERALATF